jgi:hypothetical protein
VLEVQTAQSHQLQLLQAGGLTFWLEMPAATAATTAAAVGLSDHASGHIFLVSTASTEQHSQQPSQQPLQELVAIAPPLHYVTRCQDCRESLA